MSRPWFWHLFLCSPSDSIWVRIADQVSASVLAHLSQGDAALTEQTAAGFFAFEQALASGLFPHAHALKGQCVDRSLWPASCSLVTSRCSLTRRRSLLLQPTVTRQALWQTQRLQTLRDCQPSVFWMSHACASGYRTISVRQVAAVMLLRGVVQAIQRSGCSLAYIVVPSRSLFPCSARLRQMFSRLTLSSGWKPFALTSG
ncbi:hypothetical protein [Dictyobacter formicarum]|uniref:hypothetical protein n=1 Tax=Dictyobacter formicarum TaxID=2778368 RepID=UPI001915483A|nr:hypothetical protein [Dictyobacter formicarum]